MRKRTDMSGKKIHRLTFISFSHKDNSGRSRWLCLCDCGNETIVDPSNAKKGHIKSCGCLRSEIKRKHGRTKTDTYHIWKNIIQRCTNPNNPRFKDYGGRGINVCARWMEFSGFLEDMGVRPSNKLSIDRIDVDGDYSKENCRWATATQQSRNIRPRPDGNGINGVTIYKPSGKYLAVIGVAYKVKHLGYFDDFFEAVCARKSAENKYDWNTA